MNSLSPETQFNTAVQKILNHDVVAMPTETVYGLAGRISSEAALQKIFAVKKRPFFDPLIVHVASIKQAKSCFQNWNEVAEVLTQKFWPGPLTLVMPKSGLISDLITSGLETVGVRWPSHSLCQKLIENVGEPLAAPSANLFGRTSPTSSAHVYEQFGNSVFVLEGGDSNFGIESTVLLIQKNELKSKFNLSLLRPGSVTKSEITQALNSSAIDWSWIEVLDRKLAPGQMKHHYMPNRPLIIIKPSLSHLEDPVLKKLILDKMSKIPDEIEGVRVMKPQHVQNFEPLLLPNDAVLAARQLYSKLRQTAETNCDVIIFRQSTQHQGELWESVFDRLYKAASLILE